MKYNYVGNTLLNSLNRNKTPQYQKTKNSSRLLVNDLRKTRPKFYQSPSTSSFSLYRDSMSKLSHHNSHNKIFNKLAYQLQTIQQNISRKSGRKRKLSTLKQKILTQASQDPKQSIYNKIVNQINEIKTKNRMKSSTSDLLSQVSSQNFSRQKDSRIVQQQKTLFYGVDEIDKVLFRIKIKLSKTYYRLYAKNKNSKIMLEMSYNDYIKLHNNELKGNPCNIFSMLKIKNNQILLYLKPSLERQRAKSFKSFLSYY